MLNKLNSKMESHASSSLLSPKGGQKEFELIEPIRKLSFNLDQIDAFVPSPRIQVPLTKLQKEFIP